MPGIERSCPQCAAISPSFFIPWPLQGLSATLPARSLTQLRFCQYLNVVHHAVQVPLGVALDALAGVGCETAVGQLRRLVLRG